MMGLLPTRMRKLPDAPEFKLTDTKLRKVSSQVNIREASSQDDARELIDRIVQSDFIYDPTFTTLGSLLRDD